MNRIEDWAFAISNLRKATKHDFFESSLGEIGFSSAEEALIEFKTISEGKGLDNPFRKFPGYIIIYDEIHLPTVDGYSFEDETTKIMLAFHHKVQMFLSQVDVTPIYDVNELYASASLYYNEVSLLSVSRKFISCSYAKLC